MNPNLLKRILIAAVVVLATASMIPQAAWAQIPVSDTVRVQGLSSLEEGRLLFFNMNRAVHSTRAQAMGGAGIAMQGGIEMYSLNPANILGAIGPELMSQGILLSGKSTVNGAPSRIETGTGKDDFLDVGDYRVDSSMRFDYSNLSFGLPVILLGGRGSVGLSYQRHRYTAYRNEIRFDATGRAAGDQTALVGISNKPQGGYDAFTASVAREFASFLDLGVNFSFHNGTLKHDTDSGISAEFPVAQGSSTYEQKFDSFNVDLGARFDLGSLSLGGIAYLGHDVDYKETEMISFPFPDLQASLPTTVRFERVIAGHKQSIPTTLGFGGAYTWKRLTATGDLTVTPWSESEISRQALRGVPFFSVPNDSTKFGYALVPGDSTDTFSAKLEDSNSLRLGLQFMAYESETIKVPIWLGYRKERLTVPDIEIGDQYKNFEQLILDYWRYVEQELPPPDGVDPAQIEEDLIAALESNQFLFNKPASEATTITFGSGITLGQVTFDLAVDYTSWDATRWFFGPFDARLNRSADKTVESLSTTSVTLGAKMAF